MPKAINVDLTNVEPKYLYRHFTVTSKTLVDIVMRFQFPSPFLLTHYIICSVALFALPGLLSQFYISGTKNYSQILGMDQRLDYLQVCGCSNFHVAHLLLPRSVFKCYTGNINADINIVGALPNQDRSLGITKMPNLLPFINNSPSSSKKLISVLSSASAITEVKRLNGFRCMNCTTTKFHFFTAGYCFKLYTSSCSRLLGFGFHMPFRSCHEQTTHVCTEWPTSHTILDYSILTNIGPFRTKNVI